MKERFRKPPEPPPTDAEVRVKALIEQEATQRADELQRTLAIARAESASLLAREARRIADQQRAEFTQREEAAATELFARLVDVQQRVEERISGWSADLERMQQRISDEIARLEQRQRHLVSQVEARIALDGERLVAESQEQHKSLGRLRTELERAVKDSLEKSTAEIELHSAERRRALHEVNDRLRKRERALAEQIEREQVEAARTIEASFSEVERRQIEGLERTVRREAERLAEAAALQFDGTLKAAREDAARRLARELDRAVGAFAREGERVLNERLAELGESGIQRLVRTHGAADRRTAVRTNFPEEGSSETTRT